MDDRVMPSFPFAPIILRSIERMTHMDRCVFRYLPLLFLGVLGCTSVQYTTTSDCGSLPSDTFWSGNVALQVVEERSRPGSGGIVVRLMPRRRSGGREPVEWRPEGPGASLSRAPADSVLS